MLIFNIKPIVLGTTKLRSLWILLKTTLLIWYIIVCSNEIKIWSSFTVIVIVPTPTRLPVDISIYFFPITGSMNRIIVWCKMLSLQLISSQQVIKSDVFLSLTLKILLHFSSGTDNCWKIKHLKMSNIEKVVMHCCSFCDSAWISSSDRLVFAFNMCNSLPSKETKTNKKRSTDVNKKMHFFLLN